MSEKAFTQDEVKKLTEERNLYARLLEEANLRFEEKVRELSLLRKIGDIVSNTFDIESFCRNLVSIIIEETNAENCSLLLKEQNSENLILKVACGRRNKKITFFEDFKKSKVIFSVGEGVAGKVALEGEPILINDVNNDDRFDQTRKSSAPIGSLLCCPLILQKQVIGVVNLSNSNTHAFNNSDLRTITIFSAFVSSILSNAISYVELKRAYNELESTQKQLINVEKMKALGEMSAGIAHDFNNVLAAILGRAQLLKMNIESPPRQQERRKSLLELKDGLAIIEKAAKDGAETVRRIQEFARRKDDDKYFTSVEINEIINHALEFTRARWKDEAEAKGTVITIQKVLSPLPPVAGSTSELGEVFTNLINNALDAMPQGGHITIKTFKEDSHICMKVEDTGIGIPKALKDRIFDPFFSTKGPHSTGLGLSVSYGIINRHRGTITVDSIEGQGTTFTITLPIAEKIVKEEKEKSFEGEQRKARILVIEDEEEVRNVLSAILTTGGHEVEVASDGMQGIELFTKKEFDLVFTDLGMPVMSGWQVAEKIKSINGRVPVALITGWNIKLEKSEMKDKYVDLVIQKPFEIHQVLRLVQEGIELRDRFNAA